MISFGMSSSPSSWSVLIVALLTLFALTAGISLSVPSASSLTSMLSPARRPRSFAKSLGIETDSVEYPTFWSLLVSSKVSIYQSLLYEPYSYTEESTLQSDSDLKRNDFSWMIGGAQGSGVDTSANIFARAAASGGLYVFGKREYYSNIKGENSYFQVRLSKYVLMSHVDTVDMLETLGAEIIESTVL